ncbi:MAG: GPR endopeptidase [Clostridia bacterium]|nr:GPR endopeptidase [Clostridia bacterium]
MRTDMAIERYASLGQAERAGVDVCEEAGDGCKTTKITVRTPAAGRALGKPEGVYYTFETDAFPDVSSLTGEKTRRLADLLTSLLPDRGRVLVVGLGNLAVTPDALGPKTAAGVLATAHLPPDALEKLPSLRSVAALTPGVSGKTGLEASEIVKGVVRSFAPAAVIAVDALAAGSVTRLGNNVQLSSAGVEPGAGVGNARKALSEKTLGVPVIAVGVPTVVDALTLAGDVGTAPAGTDSPFASMMVTPRDIDAVIDSAARFLSLAVNLALQPSLTPEELLSLA